MFLQGTRFLPQATDTQTPVHPGRGEARRKRVEGDKDNGKVRGVDKEERKEGTKEGERRGCDRVREIRGQEQKRSV